jgi:Ser/Thr protein kinase RdoA (MazF antagonist)
MSEISPDPLQVIAVEAPVFSGDDAVRIAAEHYGLAVEARELVSERDRNFQLRTADGREFVLKIANSLEDPLVTDFQIQALRHLEARNPDVATPRVVSTPDGRLSFALASEGREHIVRLVTWVPGVLLAGRPLTTELCRSFGVCAAKLGRALEGFEHPGSNPSLIWNMHETARVREIAPCISEAGLQSRVIDCLERFEHEVLPRFSSLRTQVVHNDLNPENVLLDPGDASRVSGVIDFGDMTRSPLIVDVAVAAAYMRSFQGDPLSRIATFVAAYHAITPLDRDEIDLIYDLIQVRLATTVSVLHWRIADRGGAADPYLDHSVAVESTAAKFFAILDAIPREHARRTLRQACASADIALARDDPGERPPMQ